MNYDLKSKILDYFIDTLDSNPKEFQKDKIKPDLEDFFSDSKYKEITNTIRYYDYCSYFITRNDVIISINKGYLKIEFQTKKINLSKYYKREYLFNNITHNSYNYYLKGIYYFISFNDFIIPINKNDWNTFFQLYTASMFNHLIDKPEDNNELDFKKFVENIKTNERT
jgi:hypothetical protein